MDILIDTDIGGDVDDALALALALCTPKLNVIGISLVYIDNTWRHDFVDKMLDVFERRDIPVVKGAEKPLIGKWANDGVPWTPRESSANKAAEFIIKSCDENPDLVIVPIGPLTNIAAAIATAPRIAKNRKIVLMGGTLNQARSEWNILCDPEAAAIVLESGADITMVGLNVTEPCQLTSQEVESFANAGTKAKCLHGMMKKFIKDFNFLPVPHDPLAVSVLIWDDLLVFERKKLAVELSGAHSRGQIIETSSGAEVKIATDVNAQLFKERLIQCICC